MLKSEKHIEADKSKDPKKIKRGALAELVLRNLVSLRRAKAPVSLEFSPEILESERLDSKSGTFVAERVRTDGLEFLYPQNTTTAPDTLIEKVSSGRYPTDMLTVLASMAHGGVMLDIGANIGLTSIPRAVLGLFDEIHAFEPEPRNAACLRRGVEINQVRNQVVVWERALGDRDGTIDLTLSASMGRHCIVAEGNQPIEKTHSAGVHQKVSVPVNRLDTWVDEAGMDPTAVRFVKVDTEASNPTFLKGRHVS